MNSKLGITSMFCVALSMAFSLALSQPALAWPLACCDANFDCVHSSGPGQVACSSHCPADHQVYCEEDPWTGPCGRDSDCQLGPCDCEYDIPTGCCLAAGGEVVSACSCVTDGDPLTDVASENNTDLFSSANPLEEEASTVTTMGSRWPLAIPLILLVSAVPVVMRRRKTA